MTIHELLALTGLTANDEIPVWDEDASGEPTKKITAQDLAAAIKTLASLLGTGDVVNDLTSTATDKPLSAAQGKVLNDNLTQIVKSETRSITFAGNGISNDLWPINSANKLIGAYENSGSGYMIFPTNYGGNVCFFAWDGTTLLKNTTINIIIHYI